MSDRMLSAHFSFNELTVTSNAALQEQNRREAEAFLEPLSALALMLEMVREKTGPLRINSGFRCAALNGATAGSSSKSQHLKGEAVDMIGGKMEPTAENVDGFFEAVLRAIIEKAIPFGQLIKEEAERDYGVSRWVHLSLGVPFRPKEVCGQVMRMRQAKGGKAVYELLKKIDVNR